MARSGASRKKSNTSVSRKGSGISAESSESKADDPQSSFEKTCDQLKVQLYAHEKSHETRGGVRGLTESPRAVCEDNDGLLEQLFKDLQCLNEGVHEKSSGQSYPAPVRFRHAVISRPAKDSRARIFFILIDLKIAPDSPTWSHFIRSLCLHNIANGDAVFGDSNLPFKDIDVVRNFLGPLHAEAFQRKQYEYCEPIEEKFGQTFEDIKSILTKTYVTCARCKTGVKCETIGDPQHVAIFCPDSEPSKLVKSRPDLIKSIYVESLKASVLKLHPGDIIKQYTELETLKERSIDFFNGVQSRAKIFATLIEINIHATSEIWKNFIRICLGEVSSDLQFCDTDLPIPSVFARERLGDTDAETFRGSQYIFCPAILEEYEPRDTTTPLQSRLPLTFKESIKNKKVFRVKIAPHHFRDESRELNHHEKEFVMKQVNPKETDETSKLAFIFKQPLTHESIMRARASVKIEADLYIFFNHAYCDLYDFMMKTEFGAEGPCGYDERIRHLRCIVEVADALEYLHDLMKDKDKQKYSCYHKDIKADNILVTVKGDRLVLQITDFGISSIKEMVHKDTKKIYENNRYSQSSGSTRRQSTPNELVTFCHNCAPEAYLKNNVTASADIWAYGTVLAEFVAWLVGGRKSLCEFENRRRLKHVQLNGTRLDDIDWSFEPKDGRPVLNEGIEAWFNELIQLTTDDQHVRLYENCWNLLKDRILVCNPKKRARISEVNERLTKILSNKAPQDVDSTDIPHDFNDTDVSDGIEDIEPLHASSDTDSQYNVSGMEFSHNADDTHSSHDLSDAGDPPDDVHDPECLHRDIDRDPARDVGDTNSAHESGVTDSTHESLSSVEQRVDAPVVQPSGIDADIALATNGTPIETTNTQSTRDRNPPAPQTKRNLFKRVFPSKQARQDAAARNSPAGARSDTMPEQERADEDNSHIQEHQKAIEKRDTFVATKCLSEVNSNESLLDRSGALLQTAVHRNMVDVVNALLGRGVDPDALCDGITPLQKAVNTTKIAGSMIHTLLTHGADTEVRDGHNATPILVALRNLKPEAAGILLEHNANVLVKDEHGWTPLHYAVKLRSTTEITAALLDRHRELSHDVEDVVNRVLSICAEDCAPFSLAHAKLILDYRIVKQTTVNDILEQLRSKRSSAGTRPERDRMIALLFEYKLQISRHP